MKNKKDLRIRREKANLTVLDGKSMLTWLQLDQRILEKMNRAFLPVIYRDENNEPDSKTLSALSSFWDFDRCIRPRPAVPFSTCSLTIASFEERSFDWNSEIYLPVLDKSKGEQFFNFSAENSSVIRIIRAEFPWSPFATPTREKVSNDMNENGPQSRCVTVSYEWTELMSNNQFTCKRTGVISTLSVVIQDQFVNSKSNIDFDKSVLPVLKTDNCHTPRREEEI